MLAVAEKAEVATTVDATTETHILDKVKILIAKELPSLIADALKQNHTADHPTPTDTPSHPPSVQTLPDGSTEAKLDFIYREMILRFEAVNQRFADLIHYSDKRFEDMNKRFEEMQRAMDKRFEDMNKRFEEMQRAIDKRFEEMQRAIDKRFEDMNKRFNSLQWMIGTGIALVAALMTIYRFVG